MHWLRRIAAASVWAPDGVSAHDWRFRGIFTWVLPLTDVFFMMFGLVGWWQGVGTVSETASPGWQEWWSLGIAGAATVALLGVSFPRLWWLELAGKIPLIGLVSVYIVVLFARGTVNPQVTATAGLIMILVLLPVWRVADLSGAVPWLKKRGRL